MISGEGGAAESRNRSISSEESNSDYFRREQTQKGKNGQAFFNQESRHGVTVESMTRKGIKGEHFNLKEGGSITCICND